ncbi:hypothetical protein ACO0M4_12045 [Streptomyces sp. RGM 3693]|uniref:hypothetical protein n=1 Tax=Streptomyces sp. RGM 3693 TaxID=3413284 RepID=UPI003D27E695
MSFSSDNPSGTEPQGDSPYGGALADAAWQVLLTSGVAAFAWGVFELEWPGAPLILVGVLFGIHLLAGGVFPLAGARAGEGGGS